MARGNVTPMGADHTSQPTPERVQEAARRLAGHYISGILTLMVDIGYKTGLFEAAAQGPATSQELADRAGLNERYVREWLGAVTTGGLFTYDPTTGAYCLLPEYAACLTGDRAANIASQSQNVAFMAKVLPQVVECFRHGGGVPYAAFRPDFTEMVDANWRRIYDERLLPLLSTVPELSQRLESGIRVADVGCGTGHALNLMARAYPRSFFTGYDIGEDAIARATAEATEMGLVNVRFEVLDAVDLPADPKYDLITTFDAIHDQVDPATVLQGISAALAPGGLYLMMEPKASSNLEENLGDPFAPQRYGMSVLHCMTVSLAHGGAGLGTAWGEQLARQMLAEAGFTWVEVIAGLRPQNCIFLCRK
jgi:SAM-dependent methyltransferase